MTIQITKPEVEALINERLQTGDFKDAEDVILQALRASVPNAGVTQQIATARSDGTLREVFDAVRGLADDIDFSRNQSVGRPVDVS
jgi:hypothetical protein